MSIPVKLDISLKTIWKCLRCKLVLPCDVWCMNAVSALIWMGGVRKAFLFFIVISTNTKILQFARFIVQSQRIAMARFPYSHQTTQVEKTLTTHSIYLLIFFMLTLTSVIRQNKVGFFFQLCYLSCESSHDSLRRTTLHDTMFCGIDIFFWFVRYFTLAGFVHCLNTVKDLKIDNFLKLKYNIKILN